MGRSSRSEPAPEHRGHGVQVDRLHQVLVETGCERALAIALLPEPGEGDEQRPPQDDPQQGGPRPEDVAEPAGRDLEQGVSELERGDDVEEVGDRAAGRGRATGPTAPMCRG